MIIHSPIFSGSINQAESAYANLSGSFSGSFRGIGQFEGLEADSVAYDNVTGKPTLVSGSSQISYPQLSNIPSGIVSSSAQLSEIFLDTLGDGVISGSSQVSYPDLSNIPAGIVSGSSQIDLSNYVDKTTGQIIGGDKSFTNQVIFNNTVTLSGGPADASSVWITGQLVDGRRIGLKQFGDYILTGSLEQLGNQIVTGSINVDGDVSATSFNGTINANNGVVSGSTQVTSLLPSGVVSGSTQVQLSSTSGFSTFSSSVDTRIATEKGRVDAILSAADADKDSFAEIVALINSVDTTNDTAFASFVTSSNTTNNTQNSRLTSIESATGSYETRGRGIVSGSTQVTPLLPTGVVSGSSQVVYTSLSSIPAGIVSGSTQVTLLLPTGVVSGSGQINVASTTGDIVLGTRTSGNYVATITAGNGIVTSGTTTGEGIAHTISAGGGVVSGSAQVVGILSSLNTYTASNDTTNTTQNSRLDQLSTASGSAITRLTTLEVETANLEAFTGSINTTIKNQLNANTVVSGSSQITYSSVTGIPAGIVSGSSQVTPLLPTGVVSGSSQVNADSITNFDSNVKDKLDADGVLSGSVINGSKTFSNDVVVSGNLTVNGTTTTVNSNTVNIGDNIIVLNSDETGTPSQNGGIEIERGTSTNSSLIWNEAIDQWQAGLSGSEISLADVSSTQTLFNKTINGSNNNITNISNASLVNSSITIAGTSTALGGSIPLSTITGASGIVSSSNQVVYTSLSSIPNGIVSGSSQVNTLLPSGVVSGSIQVQFNNINNNPFSHSVNDITILAGKKIRSSDENTIVIAENLDVEGNITLLGAVDGVDIAAFKTDFDELRLKTLVSGSSQVDVTLTTGILDISSRTNLAVSDTATIDMVLTNDTISANVIGGVVSGSSQITYSGVTGIPAGIVSGSSQVSYVGLSNIPAGIVSGSTQVTPLLPSGVVSGSSQVNADTITNFDANVLAYNNSLAVVSGSAASVRTFLSLQNVTNESKATMFTSPTFTGTPIAPTAPANTNSTQIATTAYVQTELSDLIGGANAAFDTLIEISASLAAGDSQLNTLVDGKLSKASNLSDLTDTSAARTNLGLVIGTNVQAFNSTLASVAGGTYSGDDSITTIGTVTAGSVTAILPLGVVSGSTQISGLGNAQLTNSSTTIGTTAIALGASSTTLAGLTSVTSTGFTGALTGNASTATTLQTARLIGGVSFNGSANINLPGVNTAGNQSTSGNAATATTLATARLINGTSFNGSADITIANLVSGSSQITAGSTTGFATGVKTQLDANTVVSGSSQINVASTTGDIALGTRTSGNYVATMTAGTGITVGTATGEGSTPVITNTGVTSVVAGTGVGVSAATGAVTFSIGQAVATSSNVQFNSIGIGMAASATAGRIDATNDIVAYSSSDIRFKENITPIENALDKISKINGYTYDWKEENKIEHGYDGNDVGVIAQEIEEILPQLVQTRESGFKAVKYDKLVALLIAGIKEQQLQIDELKSRL